MSCAPCVDLMPTTCTVRPLAASQQLQYSHFGEIYKGWVLAVMYRHHLGLCQVGT